MISVIFDMDGVINRGSQTMPNASECIAELRELGLKVGFLTNNAGRTKKMIMDRLLQHGIVATPHEVMTAGAATAIYMLRNGLEGKRVYSLGLEGMADTLRSYGFDVDTDDEGEPCEIVVVGWDRGLTFNKIVRAQHEIFRNGAILFATNADAMYPAEDNSVLPGAGAMVAAVETASETKAILIGKPETYALEFLLEELGIPEGESHSNCWVIGDRLDTDIACGLSYGARTVLVTTGITSREKAENAPVELKPEFIIDSLSELPQLMMNS